MIRTPFHRLALALTLAILQVALAATPADAASAGPTQFYLALGDSLAFGFQPDLDFTHGYADDVLGTLLPRGVAALIDLGCPGETSATFTAGNCPYPFLRRFPYLGSQLDAGLSFMHQHAGQVGLVTLDLGANDLLPDMNARTCAVSSHFRSDLASLDRRLRGEVLPRLHAALAVKGQPSGELILLNYYDPYQNGCPGSVTPVQLVNQHLREDLRGYGTLADVFAAFGGSAVPNAGLCAATWMCSAVFPDVHPTTKGYHLIADTIAALFPGGSTPSPANT